MFAIACDHKKGFVKSFSIFSDSDGCFTEDLKLDPEGFIRFDEVEAADNYCELLSNIFMDEIFIVVEI